MIKAAAAKVPDQRVITPMPPKLLDRVDREWHKRMLPSRSATIRKLLEEALEK